MSRRSKEAPSPAIQHYVSFLHVLVTFSPGYQIRVSANNPATPTHKEKAGKTGDQTPLYLTRERDLNILVLYCSGITGKDKAEQREKKGENRQSWPHAMCIMDS